MIINPSDRAEVVMTVRRAVKARWIEQSRAAGQKLTDWLIGRIEGQAGHAQQTEQDSMIAPYISPSHDEVCRAREAAGLTQAQAAAVVLVGLRTWQRWEYNERQMPPGLWELFRIKTRSA